MILLVTAVSLLLAACRSAPSSEPAGQATALLPPPAAQPVTTTAMAAELTPHQRMATNIDAYLGRLVNENKFSGAVLVARHGQILMSKGYGMASL